jgi:hypothetical protein
VCGTNIYTVAVIFVFHTLYETHCALEGIENIAEFDLCGMAGKDVASTCTPDALDKFVDLERDDDLFQITDGDAFCVRDAFENNGVVAVVIIIGEIQHQTRAVSAFGRKSYHLTLLFDYNLERINQYYATENTPLFQHNFIEILVFFSLLVFVTIEDMKKIALGLFLSILLGGLGSMCTSPKNNDTDLGALLPKEIKGWSVSEEDKLFDTETIFDYIDGAGEIYRAYNFKSLLARQFTREDQPKIIADLFDMGSAKDAFGIFTHSLEEEDVGIGQGATYIEGLLSFWKDRFFVSLYAEEETPEAKAALFSLAESVASSISKEGQIPDIVSLFPPDNLDKSKIRYFHSYIILNYHFFVADDNILFLDLETDAALGLYKINEARSYLLLVRYPNEEKAREAHDNFLGVYMPDAGDSAMVKTEDGQWTATQLKGDLLSVIFNAKSESQAKNILASVRSRLP